MAIEDTIVAKYEALLEANAGMKSVSVDGQTITYEDLHKRWEFWKAKAARLKGNRPRVLGMDLRNAF